MLSSIFLKKFPCLGLGGGIAGWCKVIWLLLAEDRAGECADVYHVLALTTRGESVDNLHRDRRIVVIRGADLDRGRASNKEFESVHCCSYSADADQRDVYRLCYLVNH